MEFKENPFVGADETGPFVIIKLSTDPFHRETRGFPPIVKVFPNTYMVKVTFNGQYVRVYI